MPVLLLPGDFIPSLESDRIHRNTLSRGQPVTRCPLLQRSLWLGDCSPESGQVGSVSPYLVTALCSPGLSAPWLLTPSLYQRLARDSAPALIVWQRLVRSGLCYLIWAWRLDSSLYFPHRNQVTFSLAILQFCKMICWPNCKQQQQT